MILQLTQEELKSQQRVSVRGSTGIRNKDVRWMSQGPTWGVQEKLVTSKSV